MEIKIEKTRHARFTIAVTGVPVRSLVCGGHQGQQHIREFTSSP